MLLKVTSKEQAKELAQRAETAGAMIGDGVVFAGQISLPAFYSNFLYTELFLSLWRGISMTFRPRCLSSRVGSIMHGALAVMTAEAASSGIQSLQALFDLLVFDRRKGG
jgi:hypothetical protein